MKRFCIFIYFLLGFASFLTAQVDNEKLVQLSGIVMDSDSLQPVMYCNIGIKGTYRGTMSDYQGYFSFVVQKGDTVVFSSVGYKRERVVIPDTLRDNSYSLIQLMTTDTINLPETIIRPLPKPHEFRQAFLALNIPDDDLTRAKKNLEPEKLRRIAAELPRDGVELGRATIQGHSKSYYHYKQVPPMNIFNPLAWAEFIKAWKRGDFKNKK